MEKIGFIGAGKMAESLIKGIVNGKIVCKSDVFAADPDPERRRLLAELIGDNMQPANTHVVQSSKFVFIAVKPNKVKSVAGEIREHLTAEHVIISIAPGITLMKLAEWFATDKVIRAMPNTPALIGEGATAFCTGDGISDSEAQLVQDAFSAVGLCLKVDENLMDAVTGLSGSGPAYIFMAIQALSDGGVKMGLPREVAVKLAAQTVKGAAGMVLSGSGNPEYLKDAVTTPGGTTIEAVHVLEKRGLRNALITAVEAAAEKSKQIGL